MVTNEATEFGAEEAASKSGTVYLVGAGPGDPRYITLRGIECLGLADVVLYDYLVNARLLDHVRDDAERICLGRHGRQRRWTQDAINEELVRRSQRGERVVRLKSGDPTIFGRFADEASFLRHNNVEFEVVPGVSVGVAAGSCVGIPLTHRDFASAVAFVTGQEHGDKETESIDYHSLARFPGTIVMYMGVTTARRWAPSLIDAGMSANTPVALIRRCSFHDQKVLRCELGDVVDRLTPRTKFPPPVIAVIGRVAHAENWFDWYSRRPLVGQSILVTRPSEQMGPLSDRLIELGAGVRHQPAIEIVPPVDWTLVDTAISKLDQTDWLVFASANGVRYFLNRLFELGDDTRSLGGLRLAAMGPQTARRLSEFHLRADLVPSEFRAESMRDALIGKAAGKRLLLVRASRGRDLLADELSAAGVDVQQVVVYQSRDVTTPDPEIVQALEDGELTWTTVTSSAIARSLVSLFGQNLRATKLASISPITSQTLRELGFEPAVEANVHTMAGLVDTIIEHSEP